MTRPILEDNRIHPAIREKVSGYRRSMLDDVGAALAKHPVVVIGMRQNPFPKKACKALDAAGIAFHYLEYGSYFSMWRQRLALKMWTGWSTFPMVFVKGTLVGGFEDLQRLLESGELKKMLS